MDPTDPLDVSTDIGDDGSITDPSDNPSNGLSATDLLSQLIGTAGNVAVANQAAAAQVAQAQYAAQVAATNAATTPGTILTSLSTSTGLSSSVLLLIGVAFVFMIALRK